MSETTDSDDGADAEITADADDDGTHEITAAEQRQRQNMRMRQALVAAVDSELGGGKDKYETFNWDKNPTVEQYYGAYLRNAYARAVCDMPVETTWRDPPKIVDKGEDSEETDTEFEEAVEEMFDELDVPHYLKRADILSGIGQYGVVVLEYNDTDTFADFQTPVEPSDDLELEGLRPFSQISVDEIILGEPGSDRWGDPVQYTLDLTDENDETGTVSDEVTRQGESDELRVHYSRVLHIPAEGMLDDEIRGTPRLEPIWNNITDIEKALGSAGELAYRASAWGLNVNIAEDYELEDDGSKLDEQLKAWYHGLEPVLQTQGAESVESLGGETIDPKNVIDPNIEAISAEKDIPQSVLKGNETGERATEQDLKEFYGATAGRRSGYVDRTMVSAFVDHQLEHGTLPEPEGQRDDKNVGGFRTEWEPLAEEDMETVAEVKTLRAEVLETWPEIELVLTMDQQRQFIEDGSLPEELDDLGVPESELEPPEMDLGQGDEGEDGPDAGAEGEMPPAMADGGEQPEGDQE